MSLPLLLNGMNNNREKCLYSLEGGDKRVEKLSLLDREFVSWRPTSEQLVMSTVWICSC